MKYVIYIAALLVAFGLEVGLFGQFPLLRTLPDIVLIIVVYFSVKRNDMDAYMLAVVGGLLMDFYSGTAVGTFTIGYILIVALAHGAYRALIVYEVTWKQMPIILMSALLLLYIWILAFGWLVVKAHWFSDAVIFSDIRSHILPQMLYTLLALYPILAACAWLERIVISLQHRRHAIK